MAENTYSVGYSTNARAKCKYSGCGETIAKDDIRFTKSSTSAFSDRPKCEYYHAKCMFLSFVRARKTTKKIESMSDIEGVENLKTADKDMIKKLVKEWKSGNMKDQVPKITRKRKADGDQDDDKKKKKKTDKSKKSKKTQDSDEEEDSSFKLSKSRKATKSSDDDDTKLKKSSSSKKQDSDEDEDEDEDDDKFNRILKGRTSSNTKRVVESESEDKSEEEKTKPKRKAKTSTKKTKSDESEEVKESASSEEENDKFLSGKIIALCGKLSLPREKVIELIEKNGGKYAKTITNKDVTHVICAKTDDKTQKLQKAKEAGKILVTESFLKKGK